MYTMSSSAGAPSYSARRADDKVHDPLTEAIAAIKRRSPAEKGALAVAAAVVVLLLLYVVVEDHDILFQLSEACHLIGLGILGFKLHQKKSAAGLSIRSQILTAVFLGVRLYCSLIMEYDVHTFLDFLTLSATLWIIFVMATTLHSSWQSDKDTLKEYYILVPCALLALISHPGTSHAFVNRVLWAFCVYVEAVSVAPQLQMMRLNKVVEKFTGHYVFFLGIARFFSCAHWILQLLGANSMLWQALGTGIWPVMVLISEIVQTTILADFCYLYIKTYASGMDLVHLPAGIV